MWPTDDDDRTEAAIKPKIGNVMRFGNLGGLGWRGASDGWLEKWWSRFETEIFEALVKAFRPADVPAVEGDKLVIRAGDEIRGTTVLPPTRGGWQRFLELAPKSGLSFTDLREVGLSWWSRKIPVRLLASAEEAAAEDEAKPDPKPSGSGAAGPARPRMRPEDQQYAQAELAKHEAESRTLSSEETDRRVIENLILQHTASMDALAMFGASKKDRGQQGAAATQRVEAITILRAEASVLRRRGYGVQLLEGKGGAVNAVGRDGQLLGVRLHLATPALWFANGLDTALEERFERDMREVQELVQTILREEQARVGIAGRPGLDEPMILAIWRRAREVGAPEALSAAKDLAPGAEQDEGEDSGFTDILPPGLGGVR